MDRKILLHVCCGPCSITPILRLKDEGYEVIALFMNPNIHPLAEYLRRREGAAQCAEILGIEIIFLDEEWNIKEWLARQLPDPESPGRCEWCCESRISATQAMANKLNIPFFSSSLLYSIYQPHEIIRKKGEELSAQGGSQFYYRDFREGWKEGIELSKEWGIYRQPYCGCIFSEAERYAKKLKNLKN